MIQEQVDPGDTAPARPSWSAALRALREASGVSQESWAAQLGYSRSTVHRWEAGTVAPDAAAEQALVVCCGERRLFRHHKRGPLAGQTLSADWLHDLLAEARRGSVPAVFLLRTTPAVGAVVPVTLPMPLTSFIGREAELDTLGPLLASSRLLTLTGPGGIGKTRLAIELARCRVAQDGLVVVFVPLATVTDPERVAPAIAAALDLREVEGVAAVTALQAYLQSKRLLLLLDNFEQVVAAAPLVSSLLAGCPGLTVLATSRSPLHVSGEQEFAVPLLAVPEQQQSALPVEQLVGADAVALFVQRAQAASSDFRLTSQNAAAVVAIVRRLDGLPLAIELAAARSKVLPPQILSARLSRSLNLLSGGHRDVVAHQQTVRDTIAWSFDLLSPPEQILLQRLAVFEDGCTIVAAETVCNPGCDPALDVLDGLLSLCDKSLLRRSIANAEADLRFSMLATIHEFALERLTAGGELEIMQEQFAAYCTGLAKRTGAAIRGPGQKQALAEVKAERNNLRAMVVREIEAGSAQALDVIEPLGHFWWLSGYGDETRRWMGALLATPVAAKDRVVRARLLFMAGLLQWSNTRYEESTALLTESVAIWRDYAEQDIDAAHHLAEALLWLGITQTRVVGQAHAVAFAEEGLARFQQLDDAWGSAFALVGLGLTHAIMGDDTTARPYTEAGQQAFRIVGDRWWAAIATSHLGSFAFHDADYGLAGRYWRETLPIFMEFGDKHHFAYGLSFVSTLLLMDGDAVGAARLLGAEEIMRQAYAVPRMPLYATSYQKHIAAVQLVLGEAKFATAWAEGRALSVDQAMAEALAGLQAS